jgi:hypothetical protein
VQFLEWMGSRLEAKMRRKIKLPRENCTVEEPVTK